MKRFVVIIIALAALVAFTAPAFAAEAPGPSVVVGGRMLTDFGYQGRTKELTTNKKDDVTTAFVNLAAHSYLNAKFTSADKTSGGLIELGLGSKIDDNESVSLRYAYGFWKVGNCRLVAGQDDGWLGSLAYLPRQFLGLSQSAKLLMCGFGFVYGGRNPQVRLEWMKDAWGFSIALTQPGAEEVTFATAPTGTDLYANLPGVDLALQFKAGGFMTTPAFGVVQLKYEGAGSADDTVTAWIATLPMKFTAGAFTVKGGVHYASNGSIQWNGEGLNIGSVRAAGNSGQPDALPVWVNGKVEDTKTVGGYLTAEYTIGQLMLVAGGGAEQLKNDNWKKLGYRDTEYTRTAFFVAAPYQVTQNFSLHPELSYWDYGDSVASNNDAGNEWLLGVQFRFVF